MAQNGVIRISEGKVDQLLQSLGVTNRPIPRPGDDVVAWLGPLLLPTLVPLLRPIIGQQVADAIRRQTGSPKGAGKAKSGPNGPAAAKRRR